MRSNNLRRIAAGALSFLLLLTSVGCGEKKEADSFKPRLDTGVSMDLQVLGFFGNFEALDQVTNDFNAYYPGISFSYQQVGASNLEAFLDVNPSADIFMVSPLQMNVPDSPLISRCVDLSTADVDLSAIDGEMLKLYNYGGKQAAIPMSQDIYGLIVNNSLLKKEGLTVPGNTEEFLSTMSALKEKGYTPLMGPTVKIAGELTRNYAFSLLSGDPKLLESAKADSTEAAQALIPAFDFLRTVWEKGYTDPAANDALPKENYDASILRFFEGDVPFWVCDTEKVSGMKKRESKSEAFQAAPFSYSFIYTPLGQNGSSVFRSPWFGFSANANGSHTDYAIEFLRFLAQKDEINKIADIKGVPSVARKTTNPAIYQNILSPDALQKRTVNTGAITPKIEDAWNTVTAAFAAGTYDSSESAAKAFLESLR